MASGMQNFKDPKSHDTMSDNASSVGARELYVFMLLSLSLFSLLLSLP